MEVIKNKELFKKHFADFDGDECDPVIDSRLLNYFVDQLPLFYSKLPELPFEEFVRPRAIGAFNYDYETRVIMNLVMLGNSFGLKKNNLDKKYVSPMIIILDYNGSFGKKYKIPSEYWNNMREILDLLLIYKINYDCFETDFNIFLDKDGKWIDELKKKVIKIINKK